MEYNFVSGDLPHAHCTCHMGHVTWLPQDLEAICRHNPELDLSTNVQALFPDRTTSKIIDGHNITGIFASDLTLAEVKRLHLVRFSTQFFEVLNRRLRLKTGHDASNYKECFRSWQSEWYCLHRHCTLEYQMTQEDSIVFRHRQAAFFCRDSTKNWHKWQQIGSKILTVLKV